jgi:hypothetical protein
LICTFLILLDALQDPSNGLSQRCWNLQCIESD